MNVPYKKIIEILQNKLKHRSDLVMERVGVLHYKSATETQYYPYYKIISSHIGSHDPILLIRATIHGDEPAGSFTIMNYIEEIAAYAYERGVKLVIFPMDNPSGYERGQRYNLENDHGAGGNNDCIRYELTDGTIIDDLGKGGSFKRWRWASDPRLRIHLPKETLLLHQELKKLPSHQIRGVLDIHQDNYIKYPGAYWYGFGDTSVYAPIVSQAERLTSVFRNTHVNAPELYQPGYVADTIGNNGEIVPDTFDPTTDEYGFIHWHDCTLPDLAYRWGATHAITVETMTVSPKEVCDQVNMIWIRGLIDLIHLSTISP